MLHCRTNDSNVFLSKPKAPILLLKKINSKAITNFETSKHNYDSANVLSIRIT